MSPKALIGLCLVGATVAGCGAPENTVAVPPDQAVQTKTEATPKTSEKGKPALNKQATAD